MNIAFVLYIYGMLLKFEAAFLTLPTIVAWIYGEQNWWIYLACAAGSLILGLLLTLKKPAKNDFFEREGMLAVAGSWLIMAAVGAVPLCLSGDIQAYIDALFETISGFTTTGASIMSDVESMSRSGLFWRSFTHLVGGMGVLVFMLSLTPAIMGNSIHLMRAESPGPSVSKLTPKLQTTAIYLYAIYLALTVILVVFYLCGGVPLFDSLLLAMGTAGTGGFGIANDSFASYSPYVKTVTGIFMLIFSINFNIYFLLICGKIKDALQSEEMHFFLTVVVIAIVSITVLIIPKYGSFSAGLSDSFFTVSALVSSTGFSSCDFDVWPLAAKIILLLLMFMGACAGSTGGGFKVSRILIMFKAIRQEFFGFFHPRGVQTPYFEGKPIPGEVVRGTLVYFAVYFFTYLLSLLLLSFDKLTFTSAFTGVLACINNIGPGLEQLGPTCNFGSLSVLSKIVLMFDMLAGRLELYPVLFFLLPKTWKRK